MVHDVPHGRRAVPQTPATGGQGSGAARVEGEARSAGGAQCHPMAGQSAGDPETKEQRFKEAIGSYRKYLELSNDSADGEVFYNMGRSFFNLGGFFQSDSAWQPSVFD